MDNTILELDSVNMHAQEIDEFNIYWDSDNFHFAC